MVFSLRNRLFDLATLNHYTTSLIYNLYSPEDEFIKSQLIAINKHSENQNSNTIDGKQVFSHFHNPLTVDEDVLRPAGLSLVDIYFYHFHATPPAVEKVDPVRFRMRSWEEENPKDWKGYFIASAFVVHAKKIGQYLWCF